VIRLPPQPFVGDVVRSALWVWLGLHVAFAFGAENPAALPPVVVVALLALVVVVTHVDRRARGLSLFLANLGFSPRRMSVLVLATAGAAEAVLQTVSRLTM